MENRDFLQARFYVKSFFFSFSIQELDLHVVTPWVKCPRILLPCLKRNFTTKLSLVRIFCKQTADVNKNVNNLCLLFQVCCIWWTIMQTHVFKHMLELVSALCSRNFQNVKLRLDFVELWSFYRRSDFTWNQVLVNSNGPKMSFLPFLEILNFDFSKIWATFKSQIYQNSKFWVSEIAKNDNFGQFEFAKMWFHAKSV